MALNTYQTAETAGARVAQLLSSRVHLKLADLADLSSMMVRYDWTAGGSDTQRVSTLGTEQEMEAATSESDGSNVSATSLDIGFFDLTVARYLARMSGTDLFNISGGAINIDTMVEILVGARGQTLTKLLCDLFPNIATEAGSTGQDLSVDVWFDAKFALNLQKNPARTAAVLHMQQVNDLRSSIRAETGAIERLTTTQEQLERMGQDFQGTFAGVEIFQSSRVGLVNASADRAGAMFSMGAFSYSLADLNPIRTGMVDAQSIVAFTNDMFVERDRNAGNSQTEFIVNMYPAVSESEDLRAVKILSDA